MSLDSDRTHFSGAVCVCMATHTHTQAKFKVKGEKARRHHNRRNVYKKKSCVLVFRLSLFSLIECQSFLILPWNQVPFMIS